jgi:carboxymethylenebutenolidase
MIQIASNGSSLPAYEALPSSGKWPGVIVIQEYWGLVPHIERVADRLAEAGFVAVAPDLYHGKAAKEPDEAGKMAMALKADEAARDLSATVDYLLNNDAVQGTGVGVIGFCMGGGLALSIAALRPEVAAVVPFYGFPRDPNWNPSAVKGAVLGHYAEHDHISLDQVQQAWNAFKAAGLDATYYVYPGTNHAFFNDDRPQVYNSEAAALAWDRTIAFLHRHLG